jgi:hypothetical protein
MLLTPRKVNPDGSRNVCCNRCGEFISRTSAESMISTALCIICQGHDEGIVYSEAQLRELRAYHTGESTLSIAAAFPITDPDPLVAASGDEIDAQVGKTGYFLKALVKARDILAAAIDKIPQSKQIATEKKRKRVFELPLDKQ